MSGPDSNLVYYLAIAVASCFPFWWFVRCFKRHEDVADVADTERWMSKGEWLCFPAIVIMSLLWFITWPIFAAIWARVGIKLLCSSEECRLWHLRNLVIAQEQQRSRIVANEKRRAVLAEQELKLLQRWHQLTDDRDQVPELQQAVEDRMQAEADIDRLEAGEIKETDRPDSRDANIQT